MADLRTVGIEEEMLLVRAATGELAPNALDLIQDPLAAGRLAQEFKREQIEIASQPCDSMTALTDSLNDERQHLRSVAARHGLVACASGTSPLVGMPTRTEGERFERITEEFALLAAQQLTCGMHVHVSVESPHEGVAVLDRIRGWLPVLTALCVNSPFWQGIDSGYASYRMVVLSQLPPAGPAPIWGSLAAYRRAVEQTMATGAAFDAAMIYFDARLSATYPTVEIRVTDVCRDARQAVAIAALCRALVDTAAASWAGGEHPVDLATPALRSASWRAARHGLAGTLYEPARGRLTTAWEVVERLLVHVGEALAANEDESMVRQALQTIRDGGTGADLQRKAWATGQSLNAVLFEARITDERRIA
jgi:carboxylate-amine ligase